jgi:hypothetical protein
MYEENLIFFFISVFYFFANMFVSTLHKIGGAGSTDTKTIQYFPRPPWYSFIFFRQLSSRYSDGVPAVPVG